MFVLDTDILTLLFAGHPRVVSRRDSVPAGTLRSLWSRTSSRYKGASNS